MGLRFRRSIRLLPGVRLNFSRSGISTSLGGHGATVNLSHRGVRTTVGLPGTGLSYSHLDPHQNGTSASPAQPQSTGAGCLVALVVIGIGGAAVHACSLLTIKPVNHSIAATPMAVTVTKVAVPVANCRRRPTTRSAIAGRLARNDTVVTVAEREGWLQLDRGCWIKSDLVRRG